MELQADIVIGGKKLSPPITGKGISKKGLQCAELTQCLLTHLFLAKVINFFLQILGFHLLNMFV